MSRQLTTVEAEENITSLETMIKENTWLTDIEAESDFSLN